MKIIATSKIENKISREIELLKSLKSPYLIEYYNFYQTQSTTVIITEFCDVSMIDHRLY